MPDAQDKSRISPAAQVSCRLDGQPVGQANDWPEPELYVNRELSLLSFQWRVLEEAQDQSNPLLERFKFLSILGSNLEEFFMVRVAGLKRQMEAGSAVASADGLTPNQQLQAISLQVTQLLAAANRCLRESLLPALESSGITIRQYTDLDVNQQQYLRDLFLHQIFPILTPLAVDPGHPFPHISNLSLNLAILIRNTRAEERFARVKIPDSLSQLILVPSDSGAQSNKQTYIWLDDLIKANLSVLFPGMSILEAHPFHIIRDAEMEIQEWEAGDLLEMTEQGVRQRRFGDVVRLQVDSAIPAPVLEILMTNLQIEPSDVYLVDGRVSLSSFKHVVALDRPDLKYQPFVPSVPAALSRDAEDDIFTAIARHDILLHHPYDSFQPIVNFLEQAAADPDVLAIKMTLYRVGKDSPVVEALLRANQLGKQVAVLVELKARFDEVSNIEWAKTLEREGVHVVYGLQGLKCHCKLALVVRQEGDLIRRYVHLGTGNYNPVTAHGYEDLGLLTADENIASDVSDIFNYLTGYSERRDYRKLLVAPINMRERFEELVNQEIEHQRQGRGGRIILKLNALVDERIIKLLYEASQAGVQIDLIVRGICCLRPGIPKISDNIRVFSIVGRFLEHSRIYYFSNGGQDQIYCGSADLMPRNLDRRVEVIFPVDNPHLARYLRNTILETYLADTVKARFMQPDATYIRHTPKGKNTFNSQDWFLSHPWAS